MRWLTQFRREQKKNRTIKSKIILFIYRFSSVFYSEKKNPLKYLFFPFVLAYYFIVELCWGVEIKPKSKVGWGLTIYHPTGIVINPGSILGENVILRQGITIGNKFNRKTGVETRCPRIGNDVEFGAYATVIGDIDIGAGSIVGALAFVDFSLNEKAVVAAQRAIIIRSGHE